MAIEVRREDRVAVVEPERVLLHSEAGSVSIRGIGDRLRLRRAPDTIDTAFDGRCKLCEVEALHPIGVPSGSCEGNLRGGPSVAWLAPAFRRQ